MTDLRPGETPATRRWSAAMYWPLTAAALLFLITYTIHVIGDLSGPAALVTSSIITLSWLVFIVDYVVLLARSRPRAVWFRHHLLALGVLLIPALRPVRLLDVFARVFTFRRSASASLRARLLIYGIGSALLFLWYIALVVLQAERHAPGATIRSFGDAVWWAFCTITTVGYGDYVPITVPGRVAAVALMVGGVVLVGLIVATISSAVVDYAAHARARPEPGIPTLHLRHRGAPADAAAEEPHGTE
jgi:voltage-gated potassium channel